MSAKIRNAPSGENASPQDSDAFPVTGSQYMQLLTLSGYVIDNVFDSDIQFTDITTGNADSDTHGYLPKLPGDSDQYLDGVGAWGVPPFLSSVSDSDVVFTDNTTNNADSDAHGFLPKLPGDSDNFLDGSGSWVNPYFLAPTGDGSGLTGITYAVVSGNDSDTGITAAELEELTDGSETVLHSHASGTSSGGGGGVDWVSQVDGALATGTNFRAMVAGGAFEIALVYIYCKTPGSASSTIVDVNLNGTTIFTTQGNRPELAYNDADQVAVSGTPEVTTVAAGDVLTWDIDQIGTGAEDLTVVVILVPSYVIGEDLSSQIDDATDTFTLSTTPPTAQCMLFYNGVLQSVGAGDYALTGDTIVLDFVPTGADRLFVTYSVLGSTIDASVVSFAPFVPTDWDTAPTTVGEALDELGDRVTTNEEAIALRPVPSYGYVEVADIKSAGTDGGTSVANTWTARIINTEVFDSDNICTLSSNQITLDAGTYDFYCTAQFYSALALGLRLRNVTDGVTLKLSIPNYQATGVGNSPIIFGRFQIGASKALEIQYLAQAAIATFGLGASIDSRASNYNEDETFLRATFRKVA